MRSKERSWGECCGINDIVECSCSLCLEIRNAERVCSSTTEAIRKNKQQLEAAEKAQPVMQPLPQDETLALQVLFFLHMPAEFRALSRLSFQAQQMLLPRKWESQLMTAVKQPDYKSWSSYYNNQQVSIYHKSANIQRGKDGTVKLGFVGMLGEPETMVDKCRTPSDGIWHPVGLAPGSIMWQGGDVESDKREFNFDPFSPNVRPEWVVTEFTERLSTEDQSLQWAMPQHGFIGTSLERGNLAIANQSDAPE